MKTLSLLAAALLLLAAIVPAHQEPGSVLKSLVDTELAFARTAAAKNTREAFLAFIADDGILFRPTAVNGKKWLLDHPSPPSDKRPLLSWRPIFAEVARAGDMGYTTGPWEFKPDVKDETPVAYGNFITVWKKQSDGTWKFAIDLGVGHGPPPAAATADYGHETNLKSDFKTTTDIEAARSTLLERDRSFSQNSAQQGLPVAFLTYASDRVRLFREANQPVIGKSAASQALTNNKGSVSWQPAFADVSRSGDLGYTYGVSEEASSDATKPVTKGNYLRIWKKQEGTWVVVVDVLNPLPDK
jgi:ketosteroid isomerase-like protein